MPDPTLWNIGDRAPDTRRLRRIEREQSDAARESVIESVGLRCPATESPVRGHQWVRLPKRGQDVVRECQWCLATLTGEHEERAWREMLAERAALPPPPPRTV